MAKLQSQYLDREVVIAVLVRILKKRRKREEEERLREGKRVNRRREEIEQNELMKGRAGEAVEN
jgi:hypothetical protein